MSNVEFTLTSNAEAIKAATDEAIITALKAVGAQAQGHATAEITAVGAVDTGRLRDSIEFDVEDKTLYVGTNVEYAPYVEFGHKTTKGNDVAARPYLRPAIEKNLSEYQQIFEQELSKIGN